MTSPPNIRHPRCAKSTAFRCMSCRWNASLPVSAPPTGRRILPPFLHSKRPSQLGGSETSPEIPLDMDDALIGRTLAHYRIDRRLGAGGMGVVYAAWDLRLDRRVALKILSEADDDARHRLVQEARAAAGLTHTHVTA